MYVNSSDQICDLVVICGDTAVLIEAKLATCTAADRYSSDYEKIKKYLEDKLLKSKGVKQISLGWLQGTFNRWTTSPVITCFR